MLALTGLLSILHFLRGYCSFSLFQALSANRLVASRPKQSKTNSSLQPHSTCHSSVNSCLLLQPCRSLRPCSTATSEVPPYVFLLLHVSLQVTSMQHTWRRSRSYNWTSIFKALVTVTVLVRSANCSADGEMPHQLTSHLSSCDEFWFLTTACCRHRTSGVQWQHNQLCCCQHSELFPGVGKWHRPLPRLDRRHL